MACAYCVVVFAEAAAAHGVPLAWLDDAFAASEIDKAFWEIVRTAHLNADEELELVIAGTSTA